MLLAVLCSCDEDINAEEGDTKPKRSLSPLAIFPHPQYIPHDPIPPGLEVKTVYGSGYNPDGGYGFNVERDHGQTPVYRGYIGSAPVYRNLGYDFNRDKHKVHHSHLVDSVEYTSVEQSPYTSVEHSPLLTTGNSLPLNSIGYPPFFPFTGLPHAVAGGFPHAAAGGLPLALAGGLPQAVAGGIEHVAQVARGNALAGLPFGAPLGSNYLLGVPGILNAQPFLPLGKR